MLYFYICNAFVGSLYKYVNTRYTPLCKRVKSSMYQWPPLHKTNRMMATQYHLRKGHGCRYIILFIFRLSTDAVVVPTIKHKTGMGRQVKHVYENLLWSVIHVFAWTDLGKQRNLSVITAKPQAQILIFPKHQVRMSSVQLRRSVGTWHSYKKKSSHTLVSCTTQFPHTHK